jgi:hypothetical protein
VNPDVGKRMRVKHLSGTAWTTSFSCQFCSQMAVVSSSAELGFMSCHIETVDICCEYEALLKKSEFDFSCAGCEIFKNISLCKNVAHIFKGKC